MNFQELSQQRYSLRKFSAQVVEPEKLNLVLQAAQSAPTAHNLQPQRVFVLQSEQHALPFWRAGGAGGGL